MRWLVTDHLGTPRMVVDRTGSLAGVSRHDYFPFGEELSAGTGGRATGQGYGQADNVRQKFTGYERDDETGLDYAKARYYSKIHGRFTSPDPLLASGRPYLPQSWNRYIYVLNNPVKLTDPTGLSEEGGNEIKHPDGRLIKVKTDEIFKVLIDTKPADPLTGRGDEIGQTVNRYDTVITVTNEDGKPVPDATSKLFYFNPKGERRENVDLNNPAARPVETVDVENEGQDEPEARSVTVTVKDVVKDIDYSIQTIGPSINVVQTYDNTIRVPGPLGIGGAPVSKTPNLVVDSQLSSKRSVVLPPRQGFVR